MTVCAIVPIFKNKYLIICLYRDICTHSHCEIFSIELIHRWNDSFQLTGSLETHFVCLHLVCNVSLFLVNQEKNTVTYITQTSEILRFEWSKPDYPLNPSALSASFAERCHFIISFLKQLSKQPVLYPSPNFFTSATRRTVFSTGKRCVSLHRLNPDPTKKVLDA